MPIAFDGARVRRHPATRAQLSGSCTAICHVHVMGRGQSPARRRPCSCSSSAYVAEGRWVCLAEARATLWRCHH